MSPLKAYTIRTIWPELSAQYNQYWGEGKPLGQRQGGHPVYTVVVFRWSLGIFYFMSSEVSLTFLKGISRSWTKTKNAKTCFLPGRLGKPVVLPDRWCDISHLSPSVESWGIHGIEVFVLSNVEFCYTTEGSKLGNSGSVLFVYMSKNNTLKCTELGLQDSCSYKHYKKIPLC